MGDRIPSNVPVLSYKVKGGWKAKEEMVVLRYVGKVHIVLIPKEEEEDGNMDDLIH